MVVAQVAPRVFDVDHEQLEELEVLVVFVRETWVAACWASPHVVVATAIEVIATMPLLPVPAICKMFAPRCNAASQKQERHADTDRCKKKCKKTVIESD